MDYPKKKQRLLSTVGVMVTLLVASVGGVIGRELVNSPTPSLNMYLNKKAHVVGCIKNGGNQAYCRCTFDKFVELYSYEEYKKMRKVVKQYGIDSDEASEYKGILLNELPKECGAR